MSARVCSPPAVLDRVTPNLSTPEDLGDCPNLPIARVSHPEPEMNLIPRRCGTETSSSPTSEAALSRRRIVSRNLFGSPTPSSVQYARDKLREMVRKESERWNFDFEAEKPLPGRYRWEAVEGEATNPPPATPTPLTPQDSSKDTPPKAPLSTPTLPKQRRLAVEKSLDSPPEPLLIVTSGEAGETTPPLTPEFKRRVPSAPGPKVLFPPPSSGGGTPSGQLNPNPASVLVKATAVDPLDENPVARKYLTTDSSRRTPKQMKITMYSNVKKRRIGQATPGAEKKAAF